MDKVSIICGVYNEEELFARHLQSLLSQTYTNFEILIIDDGSTDKTPEIAALFAKKDKRIRYFRLDHKEGYGCVRPRKYGCDRAKGAILFIVDADAYYAPDYLEKCVKHLTKKEVFGVIGKVFVWEPRTFISRYKSLLYRFRFDNITHMQREIAQGKVAAWVIKKSVYDKIGGYDLTKGYHEDIDLARRARECSYFIVYEPAAHWWHKWEERPLHYVKGQFATGKLQGRTYFTPRKFFSMILAGLPFLLIALGFLNSFFFSLLVLHFVFLFLSSCSLFIRSYRYSYERWAAFYRPFVSYLTHLPTSLGFFVGLFSRFKKQLFLFFVVLLVCLFLGEMLVRVLPLDNEGFERMKLKEQYFLSTKTNPYWGTTFVPFIDTFLDYTGREKEPNVIHFTAVPIPGFPRYGMRDDGIDLDAEQFLVALGDSFTWGAALNLEDIWTERLERSFPSTDVLNLGQGAGIAQSFALYRTVYDSLPSHQYVISAMWLGNEFIDNYGFSQLDLNTLQETENNLYRSRWFYPLIIRSKLAYHFYQIYFTYNLPVKSFFNRFGPFFSSTPSPEYILEVDSYWDDHFGNFDLDPRNAIKLDYARVPLADPLVLEGIEHTTQAMTDFSQFARDHGKTLLVVLIPFKEQVYFNLISDKISYPVDILQPNTLVLDTCDKLRIRCIDTLSDFQQQRNEKLFWDYDNHFTPQGQAVLTSILSERLKKEHIVE